MYTHAVEVNLRARPQEPPTDYLRRMRATIAEGLGGVDESMVVKLSINRRTVREAAHLLASLPSNLRYQVVATEARTLLEFRSIVAPSEGRDGWGARS